MGNCSISANCCASCSQIGRCCENNINLAIALAAMRSTKLPHIVGAITASWCRCWCRAQYSIETARQTRPVRSRQGKIYPPRAKHEYTTCVMDSFGRYNAVTLLLSITYHRHEHCHACAILTPPQEIQSNKSSAEKEVSVALRLILVSCPGDSLSDRSRSTVYPTETKTGTIEG